MPPSRRRITPEDVVTDARFAEERRERRAALLPTKQRRRVALGPYCTFYFENFETMLFQVQEMLLIEKGGEAQLKDELDAYNPLIPQGSELVATVMFEVEDPDRRARFLAGLGGVEARFFIRVGDHEPVRGEPEGDVERSREDGKTSSVHFLHFHFPKDQIADFRVANMPVTVGCDDTRYAHQTTVSEATRAELARDFAD